jgi:hypothetical protein
MLSEVGGDAGDDRRLAVRVNRACLCDAATAADPQSASLVTRFGRGTELAQKVDSQRGGVQRLILATVVDDVTGTHLAIYP